MGKYSLALCAILNLLLAFSFPSAAQHPKSIIIIETMSVPVVVEHSFWFRQGMAALGYTSGHRAAFTIIKAQGDRELAVRELKQALKRGEPDVVVTFATLASQAAYKVLKGSKIPIVFAVVSDPVGAGLIKKAGASSGENITGRSYSLLVKTKLEIVLRLVQHKAPGRPIRFGIVHSSYPSARGDVGLLKKISGTRSDIRFITREIPYVKMPQGLASMLAAQKRGIDEIKEQVDYWWQVSGPMGEVQESTDLLLKSSTVPLVYSNSLQGVKSGGLICITPSFKEGGREIAQLVHAILQGADPGKIPVVTPRFFDLGVNLTTAQEMNIPVPSDIMTMARGKVFR